MKTVIENEIRQSLIITVGRAPGNDILLTDAGQVSGEHAKFIIHNNGQFLSIVDNTSTNGTFLNGERIPPETQRQFSFDDRIQFGSFHFDMQLLKDKILCVDHQDSAGQSDIIDNLDNQSLTETDREPMPESMQPVQQHLHPEINTGGSMAGATQLYDITEVVDISERIELDQTKTELMIGRTPENDIVLNFPQVSAKHAKLTKIDAGYLVTDLQSTNGTFVNGKRIEHCPVHDGDCIQLGSVRLEISRGGIQKYDQSSNVRLDVVNVMSRNKEKIFLNKTSLSILPGELVGVLAPAGAGKSTLIECIIGVRKPTSGKVYINNLDLHDNFDSFRQWIGYVPQDDILHKELTVWQCLYYSAKLRLALSEEEIRNRVKNVLAELGLSHVKDTQIGGKKERVSGGQRKRVSLGIELMGDPGLLLFDEATTGLDPRTDREMMVLFKKLTDQGKTMIIITHNMGGLDQLDNILFLATGGYLCFYGPEADCYKYFNEDNPAQIYKHLEKEKAQAKHDEYKQTPYYGKYIVDRLSSVKPQQTQTSKNAEKKGKKFFDFKQTKILTKRNFTIKSKDINNTLMLLAQAPIIAFLLTIGFEQIDLQGSLLLIISLSAIFFGSINSCREIVGENGIFRRERMVNLNLPAYIVSKLIVFAVFCFIQSVLFLLIIFYFIDMGEKSVYSMFSLFFLTSFAGVSLGLFISAISPTQERAMYSVPIALLPQIIFAGGLFQLKNASEIISYFTISRWSFEAIKGEDVIFNTAFVVLISIILLGATYITLRADDANDPLGAKIKSSFQSFCGRFSRSGA